MNTEPQPQRQRLPNEVVVGLIDGPAVALIEVAEAVSLLFTRRLRMNSTHTRLTSAFRPSNLGCCRLYCLRQRFGNHPGIRKASSMRIVHALTAILLVILTLAALALQAQAQTPTITVNPALATTRTASDADDCAVWIPADDPTLGVIVGTDKSKKGGLYVWNLKGEQIQHIVVNKTNNVDIRQGFTLGDETIDIAVVNLRKMRQLKVFKIDPDTGLLSDITTAGGISTPEVAEPYGLCLYRRPADGAVFVIESSARGAGKKNLQQYQLLDDSYGGVTAVHVRSIGAGSIRSLVEGLVADDELGYLYASDEPKAVRKYYADPDRGDDTQITAFATGDGIRGDREGLAIYKIDETTGYLLLSSQGNGSVKVYAREGTGDNPHLHPLLATIVTSGSKGSDGLEAVGTAIASDFPLGFLVKHNSRGKNFVVYDWMDIEEQLGADRGATDYDFAPAD